MNEETLLEYVKRKLEQSDVPLAVVAKRNKIARSTLYRILDGDDVTHNKIQTLNDYFKKLGE